MVPFLLVGALYGQGLKTDGRGYTVPGWLAYGISGEYRLLNASLQHLEAELMSMIPIPQNERSSRIGWKVFGYDGALPIRQWVEIDLGGVHCIDAVVLVPSDVPTTGSSEPGMGFPVRFRVEVDGVGGPPIVLANYSGKDFPNPGSMPVFFPCHGTEARRIRVAMSKPWRKNRMQNYSLGEIMILSGNRNLATGLSGVTVRTSGSLESPPAWSRDNLIDGQSTVGAPLRRSDRPLRHGWESARYQSASSTAWAQIDLGAVHVIDEVRLVPARLPEFTDNQGYGFPGKLRVEISESNTFESSHTLLDWTSSANGNPAFNPITVPGDRLRARHVRVTGQELWLRSKGVHVFALAELQVYQGDVNVALGAPVLVNAHSPYSAPNLKPEYLTDGLRGSGILVEWPAFLQSLSRRREIQREIDTLNARLTALQPALVRRTFWSFAVFMALLGVGTLIAFLHSRRAQARAVMALQRQIAGDLHDEIGCNLASIAILAELDQRQRANDASADVTEIRSLAIESAAIMRDIVWLIQPGPHDATKLADRLRAAARRILGGIEWKLDIVGLNVAPPLDVQRHLLLALKEMLHNVIRHAKAQHVSIHLLVQKNRFMLEVCDDGQGIGDRLNQGGHGFISLRHRAALLGGRFTVANLSPNGTRAALEGFLLVTAGVNDSLS